MTTLLLLLLLIDVPVCENGLTDVDDRCTKDDDPLTSILRGKTRPQLASEFEWTKTLLRQRLDVRMYRITTFAQIDHTLPFLCDQH